MKKMLWLLCLLSGCTATPRTAQSGRDIQDGKYDELSSTLQGFNYALGTQSIGPSYGLTEKNRLIETAEAIRDMGSNILKIHLNPKAYSMTSGQNLPPAELIVREPSFKQTLDMGFTTYFFWAYNPGVNWKDGMTEQEKGSAYASTYKLVETLLTRYNGSGKTFFLGHWEGDWELLGSYDRDQPTVDPVRISGMIDWLRARQNAVDDAKQKIPHQQVEVYHYTEVNLPHRTFKNLANLTTDVLPHSGVDYVSYSAYDSFERIPPAEHRGNLILALDLIESRLPPKTGIAGKRVFVGEYGFPITLYNPDGTLYERIDEATQDARSRNLARASLEWGAPFVLYWEMYNNEIKDGEQRGYWLIDDRGRKTAMYETHRAFYESARRFVDRFAREHGTLPSWGEFRAATLELL